MGRSALAPTDPQRLKNYMLAARLGAGGQGVVYEAYDTRSGGRVAIKLMRTGFDDPELRGRFAREVDAARRVAAFCTARVLDADTAADHPYIVSEFIAGPTLRESVRHGGRLDGGSLLRLGIGIATALTAIHQCGVVHRDLKPDNVLLGPDGPRVIDFGIARLDAALESSRYTQPGMLVGTPSYMAPEVVSPGGSGRTGEAGPPADIFAWGAVVLFAATGRDPFGGAGIGEVIEAVALRRPDLSALAEPLRSLVDQALAKQPELRPTARQILLDLIGGQGTAAARVAAQGELERGADTAAAVRPVAEASLPELPLGDAAEAAYASLSPAGQEAARAVLLRLVVPGERADGSEDAVRGAEWGELREAVAAGAVGAAGGTGGAGAAGGTDAAGGVDEAAARQAVAAFTAGGLLAAERAGGGGQSGAGGQSGGGGQAGVRSQSDTLGLLVAEGTSVRLAYPALLGAWPRLRGWVQQDRETLRTLRRLERDAGNWAAQGRRPDDLYRGAALRTAEAWVAEAPPRLRPAAAEREFLAAGAAARTRTTRLKRARWGLAAVLVVCALLGGSIAYVNSEARAEQDRKEAAGRVATVADTLRLSDPAGAMQFAVAAVRAADTVDTRAALYGALSQRESDVLRLGGGSGPTLPLLSADGRTAALVGDGTLRTWDVRTGDARPAARIAGGAADAAAMTPDGRTIAVADGRRVTQYNARTGARTALPYQAKSPVTALTFTGGDTLAVTTRGAVVLRRHGRTAGTYPHHDAVAVSPDGKTVAMCRTGKPIGIFRVGSHTPRLTTSPTLIAGEDCAVAFSPDGRIVSAVLAGEVCSWDLTAAKPPLRRFAHEGAGKVAFSPDGDFLAATDANSLSLHRTSDLRPAADPAPPVTYPLGNEEAGALALDGKAEAVRLLSGGTVRTVDVWQPRVRGTAPQGPSGGPAAVLSPDGRLLLTQRAGGRLAVEPVSQRTPRRAVAKAAEAAIGSGERAYRQLVFSPDGRRLATLGRDGEVAVWRVSGEGVERLRTLRRAGDAGAAHGLAFLPGAERLAVSGPDAVQFLGVRDGRPRGTVRGTGGGLLAASPACGLLATSRGEVIDIGSGKVIQRGLAPADPTALAFHPKECLIAYGDRLGRVTLRDARTGFRLGVLPATDGGDGAGGPEGVASLAFGRSEFSEKGVLAVGGAHGTLRLWDVSWQRQLGHGFGTATTGPVTAGFSADGARLYEAGPGPGGVRAHPMAKDAAVAAVCARAGAGARGTISEREWDVRLPEVDYRRPCT
ncbi:WD40 repeat domain-containing serine/threonine protein kinase [Streptomyces boninensis]|uniref:WD40 repeat domain-containing serine/threonine protein kinase n=1 Tax=Streptomyces boninensis TaxID=2039455 RepID=UPI003B20F652